MTAWLAITVATVASETIGSSAQSGNIRKNGFSTACGSAINKRALPEIIQRQRRQHDEQPGGLDRPLAEMAEIGIERFGAGDGEKHRAERDEADDAVMEHEGDGVERIERQQAPRDAA